MDTPGCSSEAMDCTGGSVGGSTGVIMHVVCVCVCVFSLSGAQLLTYSILLVILKGVAMYHCYVPVKSFVHMCVRHNPVCMCAYPLTACII